MKVPAFAWVLVLTCALLGTPVMSQQGGQPEDLLELTGLTEEGLQAAMGRATFALDDLVRDKKKLGGKVPVGNTGVEYDLNGLDEEIERVEPDAAAERKLTDLELSGETGEARILALHTTLDPVFYPENVGELASLVSEDVFALGLANESEASHCGFTEAEEYGAWRTLVAWAEGGKQPKPKNLLKRCRQAQSAMPGPCRFQKRPKPDTLDSRILPRP